jgi:hypothetical protein
VKIVAPIALVFSSFALGCEPASNTSTFVVLENAYPVSSGLVIYDAFWQAVSFEDAGPLAPGASSGPESTVPCSANTAYAILAPGWDPASGAMPTTFVVLQSKQGYEVHVSGTVEIPVSDASFAGNCVAGSFLTQSQADFITQFVFPGIFAGLRYDAATCTTTAIGDAGAP